MVRRYGAKKLTQQQRKMAACQLVAYSSHPREKVIESLVKSYGFSEPYAQKLYDKFKPA